MLSADAKYIAMRTSELPLTVPWSYACLRVSQNCVSLLQCGTAADITAICTDGTWGGQLFCPSEEGTWGGGGVRV